MADETEKQWKLMKPKPDSETRTIFINLKTDGSRREKDINHQCNKGRRDITTVLSEIKKDNKGLFWKIFANKFDQLDKRKNSLKDTTTVHSRKSKQPK